MRTRSLALLVGLLVAGLALATPKTIILDSSHQPRALWTFLAGVTIGGSGTKISSSTTGTVIYDFPALEDSTVCAYSNAATVTGAVFGSQCLVAVDQVQANAFGTLLPVVTAAGSVKVQACATGIRDGGTFDMPDASYTVRCFNP